MTNLPNAHAELIPTAARRLSRRRLLAVGGSTLGVLLTACQTPPAPTATTAPSPAPSPATSPTTAASPTAAPSPATSPVASPSPVAAVSPTATAAVSPSPAPSPSPAASPSPSPSPVASPRALFAPTGRGTPLVKPTPPDLFIEHAQNKEMRWENMARHGLTTPNAQFFVRNQSETPIIAPDSYRLLIEGDAVERSVVLTMAEIRALPAVTVNRLLECTGNGRSFFETVSGQRASGTPWKWGAVGVAEWKGARVRDALARAGVRANARDVLAEGVDELRVRRPIPIAKANEDDTLLAYEMNGEPIPPDHGGPIRFLVPGWTGISSIKWLGRIEVSSEALYTPWNTTSYIFEGGAYQPQPPARGPIITTNNIKSALEMPWPADLRAGRQTIKGRAWSGLGRIARVEVSVDGGASYQAARLVEPNEARSWTRFEFDWEARAGSHTIRTRATDDQGNTQPDTVPFNAQGYLYNGVVPHPVTVT